MDCVCAYICVCMTHCGHFSSHPADISLLIRSSKFSGIISHLEIGLDMMWTAHRGSSRIQIWDTEQGKIRGSLPCDDAIRKQYVYIACDSHVKVMQWSCDCCVCSSTLLQ